MTLDLVFQQPVRRLSKLSVSDATADRCMQIPPGGKGRPLVDMDRNSAKTLP